MLRTNYAFNTQLNPEAYITKGKNRLKQHSDIVYLNDQDEFEIELFNPKTISVLAKIKINGNYISNRGLVIKPGQRIHLDRYIDEAKKFLFSTYEVSGKNEDVKKAIEYNGLVEVEFYDELVLSGVSTSGTRWIPPYHIYHTYNNNFTAPIDPFTTTYGGNNHINYSAAISFTSNSTNSVDDAFLSYTPSDTPKTRSIETGRVEKGNNSNTKLKDVNMSFSDYCSSIVTWHILPNSQKPVEVGELNRSYCTNCGIRIKKSNWKFCPTCGNKL